MCLSCKRTVQIFFVLVVITVTLHAIESSTLPRIGKQFVQVVRRAIERIAVTVNALGFGVQCRRPQRRFRRVARATSIDGWDQHIAGALALVDVNVARRAVQQTM